MVNCKGVIYIADPIALPDRYTEVILVSTSLLKINAVETRVK